jgi:hypothetical protein
MIMEKSMCAGHDMVDMHAWIKYNMESIFKVLNWSMPVYGAERR